MGSFNVPPAGANEPPAIADYLRTPRVGMKPKNGGGRPFEAVLSETMYQKSDVRFSAHAIRRLESRGIHFNGDDLSRLEGAMDKLSRKGARESVVFMDEMAFVVNPESRTVITAVPRFEQNDGMFTQIDSVIVVE